MLELLFYLAGHAAVASTVFLLARYFRRQPNLKTRREAIFELNHRPSRIEAGETELTFAGTEVKNIERRTKNLQAIIVDHLPLDDPPTVKWAFALISLFLVELEAAVFFLLTAPSAMLSLSGRTWAALAPPIAAGWIMLLHVLLGAAVIDKHRPARTVRRAKVGAVLFGAAIVIAIWLVLSGRNLNDSKLIEDLTGMGLIILAALLSVCGSFCSLTATTLFEAQRNERELIRLETHHSLFMRHIELVERDLTRIKAVSVPSPEEAEPSNPHAAASVQSPGVLVTPAAPSAANGMGKTGLVVTLIALFLALPFASSLHAQRVTDRPSAGLARGDRASFQFARADACEIVVDITGSNDREALRQTVQNISKQLPDVVDALGCKLLRLVPFAGDLFTSIEEVAIPAVPDAEAACRDAKFVTSSSSARAIELIYPRLASEHENQAKQRCIENFRTQNQTAIIKRSKVLAFFAERLRALGDLPPHGPCTAFYQAVFRSAARSRSLVVISDAGQTCTPPAGSLTPAAETRVLFLLIPSRASISYDRANLLLGRLAALEKIFPDARALLAPEATPAFWQMLGTPR